MNQGGTLLFYEPLTPKHYLDQILAQYPYDIDPALVYTLLTKYPAPHPALLTFIDFIRRSRKILITKKAFTNHALNRLYVKMAALAQPPHTLLHIHSFRFDCLIHYTHCPINHAYPYLAYDKIALIDEVHIAQNTHIRLHPVDTPPITYASSMPLLDLSLDPNQYFSLSISINEVHGLILIPRCAAALISALGTLYPFTAEKVRHDFLLFYDLKMPQQENIIAYDANSKQYIGCSCHVGSNQSSLTECLYMIRTLYGAITRDKHDLTLTSTMLNMEIPNQAISLLMCSDEERQKSALIEALLQTGQKHRCTITRVFENYGTIHLLDDSLYATGAQIGGAIPITSLTPNLFYDNTGEDIYLSESERITYRITSLKPLTPNHLFQPIHIIAILCNVESFRLFNHPEEVLPHLSRCYCTLDSSLHKDDAVGNALINTALLNDIPLIALPINDTPDQNAQALISWIQTKTSPDE